MSATPNLGLVYIQSSQNQAEVTANQALLDLDLALCAETATAMGDADVTIALEQAQQSMFLSFTGANTAVRNVILPAISRPYIIQNATSGGYAISMHTGGSPAGAAVSVANGACVLVYCDGVNVIQVGV